MPMDLIDRLRAISATIPKKRKHIKTEEGTKTGLVLPFIGALGYDIHDPTEVTPEFEADVGTKKGEKVDYAILSGGQPHMLIECKVIDANLDAENPTQLYRYFTCTASTRSCRLAVLTNGINYRFYSDLEKPNVIDQKPFFEFSMEHVTEEVAAQVKKYAKEDFDLEKILSTAKELKHTKGIKSELVKELEQPTEDLVRLLAARIYSGNITKTVVDQFTDFTRRAFQEFINERVNERLEKAKELGDTLQQKTTAPPGLGEGPEEEGDSVPTPEELEGYYVVKAIVRESVAADRVFYRKRKDYCGILLDDNQLRPICRLWFNSSPKCLGLFDEKKTESRQPIESVDDIFKHADHLKRTALRYRVKPATVAGGRGESVEGPLE